ncbi:MAG: hypothetical protein JNK34_06335 [Tabrizicola sp.]|nr:hypothetical protein [Tabrizicola sp.]
MPPPPIPQLPYPINLLEDGHVVTKDGEYLGTWTTDESDAFYQFIPDGASEVLMESPFKGQLCRYIIEWLEEQAG